MKFTATCYRYLLLLYLFFFIVISVFYSKTTPSTIPIRSLLSSLKVNPVKQHTCIPYNVSDLRPFFEREPPQSNLPRRISNTTRDGLLHRLRSLRLVLCGCARNVAYRVENFRKHAESIIDLFHPTSRILICESDSQDNTLEKLRQWHRAEVYSYGHLSIKMPERERRLEYCRNVLLERARQLQADYMLHVDVDIFAVNVNSFLSNFDYETNDWSVMTANLGSIYNDIWAVRTLSDTVLNYDCWHRVRAVLKKNNYCEHSVYYYIVYIHQKPYPHHRELLEVRSAFGGAGLYKMEAVKGCYYNASAPNPADNVTCEHVPFHLCIREKNNARIFINPKFTDKKFRQ
jgi:hypothetical protein